jgi:hypothetical protein
VFLLHVAKKTGGNGITGPLWKKNSEKFGLKLKSGFRLETISCHLKNKPGSARLPDGIFLVIFGGSCNGKSWYILWAIGLFYKHLVYFIDI